MTLSFRMKDQPMRLVFPVLAALMVAPPALAQSRENITVTARRVAEPLFEVPLAVSVFARAEIGEQRIDSLEDLAFAAPSFQITDPFGRLNPSATLRGLSQEGIGDEPNVAFFEDGIHLSNRSSINGTLFDLERVEIVRGPQGARYGRNSFGGAINLITRDPGEDFAAETAVTIASEDRLKLSGSVEGPLTDGLAARIALVRRDWGGAFGNELAGGPELGREETDAAALTFLWQAGPDWTVRLRGSWRRDEDTQPGSHLVAANCQPRASDGALRYFCGSVPTFETGFASNPEQAGFVRESWRAGLRIEGRLTENLRLTSLTGGFTERSRFDRDDDYSAVLAREAGQITEPSDFSQELRLSGTWDQGSWLAGLSHYRFDIDTDRRDIAYGSGATSPAGPRTSAETRTWAGFAALDYRLAGAWEIGLEARLLRETKRFESTIRDEAGTPLDLAESWTAFLPRASILYRIGESARLYASYAEGFKAGGFNSFANLFDAERVYEPDTNRTYELGGRARLAGGKLLLDAALFWIEWDDQQVTAASARGVSNNFFVNNAGGARSRGVELSADWRITEGLIAALDYAYTDATFTEYRDPDLVGLPGFPADGDVSGNLLPRQSAHQLTASLRYERPVSETLTAALRLDARYESPHYSTPANLADNGHRRTLDLRLSLAHERGELAFWVDNLTDDDAADVAIRWFDAANGFARAWLVTPRDPRSFGLTAELRF